MSPRPVPESMPAPTTPFTVEEALAAIKTAWDVQARLGQCSCSVSHAVTAWMAAQVTELKEHEGETP